MANRTFTIEVTMNERWVNDFCSMLHWMQSCGNLGHSSIVGFYSDGDGDFRPTFKFNTDWEKTKGIWRVDKETQLETQLPELEVLFDAG